MKQKTRQKSKENHSFLIFLYQKKVKSTIIILYLSILIVGYLIFFLSPLYMPTNYEKYKTTPFNEVMELNDKRKFTLLRWDYSEDQHLMELEMDVDNSDFTSDESLKFLAKTIPSGKAKIKTVVNEDSYLVIQITNVPEDFKQISFRIALSESGNLLRMYSNINDINRVDKIETLTKDEYFYNRLNRNVVTYQADLKKYESEIQENEELIEKITEKNAELEINKEYMTESEKEEINQKILDNENLIANAEKEIDTLQKNILETQNKISATQDHIDSLGKDSDTNG